MVHFTRCNILFFGFWTYFTNIFSNLTHSTLKSIVQTIVSADYRSDEAKWWQTVSRFINHIGNSKQHFKPQFPKYNVYVLSIWFFWFYEKNIERFRICSSSIVRSLNMGRSIERWAALILSLSNTICQSNLYAYCSLHVYVYKFALSVTKGCVFFCKLASELVWSCYL